MHQITCLYDMDIPKPDNFNETYLYEGSVTRTILRVELMPNRVDGV